MLLLLLSSKIRASSTRRWSWKVPSVRMSFSTRAGVTSEEGAPVCVEEGEGWWQRLPLPSNSVISEMEPSELEALFTKVRKAARRRKASVDDGSVLVALCKRLSALSPTEISLRQACGLLNAISSLAPDVPVCAELRLAVANLTEMIAQGCRGKQDGNCPGLSFADIAMSLRAFSRLKSKPSPAYSDLLQMAVSDERVVFGLVCMKLSHWCAHNVNAFDAEGLVGCVHLAARAVPSDHVDSLLK
ncbi:hypothetical protein FOZ62_026646 [Perkinsus olseni]|uniref:Uncharacterized protein n=1 Tax=Perkinsus olseni TaxID=32597 RepID=A0A7J6TVE4_PEROL|nr:hypothetical protein FOZ62_026646 [Perkinsus olseni]